MKCKDIGCHSGLDSTHIEYRLSEKQAGRNDMKCFLHMPVDPEKNSAHIITLHGDIIQELSSEEAFNL